MLDTRKGLLFVTALILTPTSAWSWGSEGHRIVGRVADLIIARDHPTAKQKLSQLLNNRSLSEVSIVADCAKGKTVCHRELTEEETNFVARNKNHKDFHFTDVAIQQPKYVLGKAGTDKDDVVQIIRHAVRVLSTGAVPKTPANLTKTEAVWELAHLVGDIHQPLHVAAIYFDGECSAVVDPNVAGAGRPNFGIDKTIAETRGGNSLTIGSNNLHSFWDSDSVNRAMRDAGVPADDVNAYAQKLVDNPPTGWQTSGPPSGWSLKWANEILPLAKQALTRITIAPGAPQHDHRKPDCLFPTTIDNDYRTFAGQQVHIQLGKAGFRLAALFHAIFGGP